MIKLKFGKPLCQSIMAVAVMMLSLQAMAYDFPYTHQGKTLYYDIISDSTVEVTYYNNSNYVSGDVVIPSTVTYNGTTYSVTSIGGSAFGDCSGLTSVTIPNSVTSIGGFAFSGCSGVTSVTIPNSVTSIGDFAFLSCSGLTSINVASGNTHYSSIDGVLYNYVQDTLIKCPGAKTSVTIPIGVTFIGEQAFRGCRGLTSVTIPNSVTSIGEVAFSGCSGLTSVTIGNSVTSIGDYVFSGCSGLTSVTIGNSVTSIGDGAFYYCSSLTSINVASGNTHYSSIDGVLYNYVQDTLMQCPCAKTSITIPNSVTSIGEAAFENCSGLTSVTIPNSVTSIGGSAFWCCSGLTSVTIGNSVTSIGDYAFSYCSGLTSVTIGNSVTSIGGGAFEDCSGLTSVTIPNSVTSIGRSAFSGCSGLASVKCLASIPPSIGNNSFQNISDTCLLTVPCGSLEAYTTSDWNTYFATRISEGLSFELSVSANDEAYGRVEVETQSCEVAIITATPNEGYEFTAWNDGNTENPRTVTITSDTAFVAIFTEAVSTPTITVTVNDATMGSASYSLDGNTAVLTATANEGYSFLTWSDGNMENPRTVTVTSDTAFMAIFTLASSLQEVNAREFALYPNPAKSFVTLEFEALKENTLLQILDLNGRRVRTFDLKAGVETLRIDLGDLPKGVYTVMLGNTTKKLIVE